MKRKTKSRIGTVILVLLFIAVALVVVGLCTNAFDRFFTKTYTVTFDLGEYEGEETVEPVKAKKGQDIKLPEAPEWEGHDLVCWRIGGELPFAGDRYVVTEDVTAYAIWQESSSVQTYLLVFDLGEYEGEEHISDLAVEVGGTVTLPDAPVWEGHVFAGWRIGEELLGAKASYTPKENLVITAEWTVEKFTVTFELGGYDGEETVSDVTVEFGKDFELPEAPAWEDHTFDGWRIGEDLKQPHERFAPTETVTATAEWTEIVKYTVTFDLGDYDGGETVEAVTVTQGSDFELPEAPAWEDHTFDGWRIGEDLKQPHERFAPTETVTATAEWTEIVKYTVTFDLGEYSGRETVAPITVRQGEGVDLPSPPLWTGYTFHGWKVGSVYKQAGEHVAVSSSVKYTAKWTKDDLLDKRAWYVLGAGKGTLRTNAWTHNKLFMTRDNSEDADNLFTIELTLYAGDQFKITYNTDWTVAFGRNDIWSGWDYFEDDDGSDHNITVKAGQDGVYTIKLYTFMTSGGETSHLDITKVRSVSPYAGDEGGELPSADPAGSALSETVPETKKEKFYL